MKKQFKTTTAFKTDQPTKYTRFDLIDGTHPWQERMKDHVVMYPVRELNKGKVSYFNYTLAVEMGLISSKHPHKMNKDLEKKILKTFSIQIINEYEQEKGTKYEPSVVKKNLYMATRYLQLQHTSRTGKTSGDGRGIWNGVIQNNGKTWDISSRGTGVTKLAPGAVEANKSLQTGNHDFGYGCGQMEIDELYSTAISSEIFHQNGIATERVLAIIDLGKGVAIGVRAAPNLIRPAHLFLFLKQNDYASLKSSVDYFIERQLKNKEWEFNSHKSKYDQFLDYIVNTFAKLTARLDSDYIFAWLDWDGDNILANAGIIDYGSIRQFGLRHDQYRYDDVDRFSTNLNEQKIKARQIIQTFAQIVEFLKTKEKKSIGEYKENDACKNFDKKFEYYFLKNRLYNIGFQKNDIQFILENHINEFQEFEKHFKYFENIKTYKAAEKVADGINKPAIFNMRDLLRELPTLLLKNKCIARKDTFTLFDVMISKNASPRDYKFKEIYHRKLLDLQNAYLKLVEIARRKRSCERVLREIENRSKVINRADRATGNAIICVVESLIQGIRNHLQTGCIQEVIDSYVLSQVLKPKEGLYNSRDILKHQPKEAKKLLFKLLKITTELKDEI